MVYVGPELAIFRELKVGDNVLVRIVESVIVEARPGAEDDGIIDTTAAAKKAPEAAQSDVIQQLKAVVTIRASTCRCRWSSIRAPTTGGCSVRSAIRGCSTG